MTWLSSSGRGVSFGGVSAEHGVSGRAQVTEWPKNIVRGWFWQSPGFKIIWRYSPHCTFCVVGNTGVVGSVGPVVTWSLLTFFIFIFLVLKTMIYTQIATRFKHRIDLRCFWDITRSEPMKSTQWNLATRFAPQAHKSEASTTQGPLNATGRVRGGGKVSNDL